MTTTTQPRKMLVLLGSTNELDDQLESCQHCFFKIRTEVYYSDSPDDVRNVINDLKKLVGDRIFMVSELVPDVKLLS
jgi:hypothetical protein